MSHFLFETLTSMVEFINSYDRFEGLEYDPRLTGHGAAYGSTSCGKTSLVRDLALNGMFSHCRTIIHLNGNTNSMPSDYVNRMKAWWKTKVYCYQIASEDELHAKIQQIETEFLAHREHEYKSLCPPEKPPSEVDMRPNRGFGNCKIIIDDLHKQVIKSESIGMKFQAIRHSGIELLFVTQSFKNVSSHDLIKENLMYVILFKLTQNVVTMKGFLQGLSLYRKGRRGIGDWSSSVEYIYHKLVQMNNTILGFNEDETCYLFINLPKRGPKKVSDLRTAISNPNIQVCLKETGCNDVKILFAKRKVPMTYDNRDRQEKFVVMSIKEQQQYLQDNRISSSSSSLTTYHNAESLSNPPLVTDPIQQPTLPDDETTFGSSHRLHDNNQRSDSPPREEGFFSSNGGIQEFSAKRRRGSNNEKRYHNRKKAPSRDKVRSCSSFMKTSRKKPEVISNTEDSGDETDAIFHKPPSSKKKRKQFKSKGDIKTKPTPVEGQFTQRQRKRRIEPLQLQNQNRPERSTTFQKNGNIYFHRDR